MAPRAEFDHIVVAAPTLAEGVSHVESIMGVTIPKGGFHPLMGTHNHVLRLGEACFLEVIAIDPEAAPVTRKRWFSMDNPPAEPRLIHWVCRLPGLEALRPQLPVELGEVIWATRGDMRWQITVPEDGSLPFGGAFPTMIDWHDDLPPTRMPGAGFSLEKLIVTHPKADDIHARLAPFLDDSRIQLTTGPQVCLTARLAGPSGTVVLT